METAFFVAFGIVLVIVLGGFVLTITTAVRNKRTLEAAGIDPFTTQAQLAAKVLQSDLLAPAATLEQRLAELDDLRSRGVISEDEHRTARAQALAGS